MKYKYIALVYSILSILTSFLGLLNIIGICTTYNYFILDNEPNIITYLTLLFMLIAIIFSTIVTIYLLL
jgi:hypothetical protein